MQAMYFMLMMIGGVFLIITFIAGEIFEFAQDVGDSIGEAVGGLLESIGLHLPQLGGLGEGGGPSALSSRVVFAFVTAFGGMGTILTYYDMPDLATIVLSLLAGFAGGAVVWAFTYALFRQSTTMQLKDADFAGATGRVTMEIPGGVRYGEASVSVRGSSETWFAVSADGEPIPANTLITVVSRNGGRLTVRAVQTPEAAATH